MSFRQQVIKSFKSARILYVDKGVIVINKPSGLVCQGGRQQGVGNTDFEFDKVLQDVGDRLDLRTSPIQVHRLDKLTTGTLLLARNAPLAKELANQFQAHTIKKSYLAIVRGGKKTFSTKRGTVNDAIFVSEDGVRIDRKRGRMALTDWELLGSSDQVPLSLLRLSLHSGLKHQLRLHLSHSLQCPVLGDTTYSVKPPPSDILNILPRKVQLGLSKDSPENPDPRMFLHASHVSLFRYRKTGKRFQLGVAAPLPSDFISVCHAAGLKQYLTTEDIAGGVYVDGVPLPKDEEVEGVEGRWLDT